MTDETLVREIEIINDLIRINNDRCEGYEKAAAELKEDYETGVRTMFFERAHESRIFKNELSSIVARLGGEPVRDTSTAGKVYRFWMDVKATFTKGSTKSVLESCEFGEQAALRAYEEALMEKISWPDDILDILMNQKQVLNTAYGIVKGYREEFANNA